MKLKELPCMERPYEKLEAYGAGSLSLAELIAIVIKTGTKNMTAVEIAQNLLKEDTKERGISFLNDFSLQELRQKEGIGRVKAIELKAVCEIANRATKPNAFLQKQLTSPEDVYHLIGADFKQEKREIIKTILLDSHNRVIQIIQNAVGQLNTASIEMKDVYREPIKCGAHGIVLVHNHPSGDAEPSEDDIKCTQKVKEAGILFGIRLIDHVIIGDSDFSSLKRLKKI